MRLDFKVIKAMLKVIILILVLCHSIVFGQADLKDSSFNQQKNRYLLWYCPNKVTHIYGCGVGVVPFSFYKKPLTITGAYVDVNPFFTVMVVGYIIMSPLALLMHSEKDTSKAKSIFDSENVLFTEKDTITTVIHGINIGQVTFWAQNINGLNVNLAVGMAKCTNGLTFSSLMSASNEFSGVQIAGVANLTYKGRGVMIGLFNRAKDFKGIQLGLLNIINGRALPLLNVQF